ncbi:hypothetical protein IFR05_012025 [Cadophora sp. M221]|nr:hypothetical protein IFR05_012025 [Cadophora sp. M221]
MWDLTDLTKVCDTLKYGGQMDIPELLLPMAQSDLSAIAAMVAMAHPSTFRNYLQAEDFMDDVVSQCRNEQNNRNQLIAAQPTEFSSHISRNVTGLKIFHKFPRLPKELRLMVWEAMLPKSRVVELYWKRANGQDIMSKVEHRELLNLRRTCRESKAVVEKKYKALPKSNYYMRVFAFDRSSLRTIAMRTSWRHELCQFSEVSLEGDRVWLDDFPQLRELMWIFPEDDDRDKGTKMVLVDAEESLENEERKQEISGYWKTFMASRGNPEALRRIKLAYKEIKRPNPRDFLARDFEALAIKAGKLLLE